MTRELMSPPAELLDPDGSASTASFNQPTPPLHFYGDDLKLERRARNNEEIMP